MAKSSFTCTRLFLTTLAILCNCPSETASHGTDYRRSDDTTLESLENLIQQQASIIQNLQARLTAAESKLSTVETGYRSQASEIAALKDARSKAVAFTARFSRDPVAITQHSTLVFDSVVYILGNGYDPHTGIFTAPYSGVYAFFLSEMANSNSPSDLDLAIMKEGDILDIVYAEGPSDANDQGSSLVTTHVTQGQRVWVRQNYGSSVRGGWYTVFTGYLLRAD